MTTLEPREATEQLPYVTDEQDWDETEDDLPVRPVRKRLGPLSLGLIGAVVAAGAFYGGVMTEKNHVTATTVSAGARARTAGTTATTTAGGRTSTTGAAGAAGGAGGGGAGAGATVGTVKLIDGTNVYVADATGNVTKVATTAQSAITITSTGTAKNIKPGDTVVVTGPTGADGTITATAIRDAGAGGAGLGFGGRTRGAGGAGAGGAGAAGAAGGFPPAGGAGGFGPPPGG